MALIDLKHLWKARITNLSPSQRRLLNAIAREPTAHLYSKEYNDRHLLTGGGIKSGLRKLQERAVVGQEDGQWKIQPPEMRRWLEVLHDRGPTVAEKYRWWDTGKLSFLFAQSPLHDGELDLSRSTDLPREGEIEIESLLAQINKGNAEGPSLEEQALLESIKRRQRRMLEEAGETWLSDRRIVVEAKSSEEDGD